MSELKVLAFATAVVASQPQVKLDSLQSSLKNFCTALDEDVLAVLNYNLDDGSSPLRGFFFFFFFHILRPNKSELQEIKNGRVSCVMLLYKTLAKGSSCLLPSRSIVLSTMCVYLEDVSGLSGI